MISSFALAFVAGLVTILNPCVLPLIPILIGSALGQSRLGPLALAAGLVTSFTIFGFTVIAFGFSLGIDERAIRMFAGGLLLLTGVVLLVPQLQTALSAAVSPLTNRGNQALSKVSNKGVRGQYLIGLLLGLVWAPCVGPTLGVAIAAASTGENLASAFFTFLIFGLGVAMSILIFAYGSRKAMGDRRKVLSGIAKWGKPLFAMALLLVGAMVLSGFDKMIEAWLIEIMPLCLIEFTTRF